MFKKRKFLVFVFLLSTVLLPAFPAESGGEKELTPKPIDQLAAYINDAQFNDFPEEVVKRAKYLILDSIGCALGGTQVELGKDYLKLAEAWGTGSESTLIAKGTIVSCMNAAFANTQLANVLDFDDTYDLYSPGHPGNALVHTAIAFGEAVGASGEEVLTAVILGYEVCLRIGRAEGPIDWEWPSIYLSSMTRGTSTVSSRLLKLDKQKIATALQHAMVIQLTPKHLKFDIPPSVTVPGIKSNFGLTAVEGILAARLAQQRIKGFAQFLNSDLKEWFLAGGSVEGYEVLTEGLGKIYRIMEVSFKPTPSCRFTHIPITALWEALDNKPVKAKEVSQIIIKGVERLNRPEWKVMLEAQFSMQCAVAMAALGIEPGPKWYTDNRFNGPDVRELAAKIKLENDPEAEELEIKNRKIKCTVKVKFKNGTVKEAIGSNIKGAPDNPMTEEELKAKFRANTIGIMSESRVKELMDAVLNLEKLPQISELTSRYRLRSK